MARLIDPRGVRYGVKYDWNIVKKEKNNLENDIYKDYFFIKYIDNLFINKEYLKKGILYDSVKIEHKIDKVKVDIYIYDSQYEEMYNQYKIKTVEFYKYKLIKIEKILVKSILKYYGKKSEITYYILNNRNISGEGLARFIGIKLMQGFDLGEAVNDIIRNLNKLLKEKDPILYGYRISCYGRFTRRQRTSTKHYKEGKLSLNMIESYIDYGTKEVYLKYGACNIKVWLNKSYKIEKYKKKLKI